MNSYKRKMRKIFAVILTLICICSCIFVPVSAQAAIPEGPYGYVNPVVYNTPSKIILLKGTKETVSFDSSYGTVKCISSNKKVVRPVASGKNKFKLKTVKNGTAKVTFKSDKISEKYTIVVASGNNYVNKWVKNLAKEVKKYAKTPEDQLMAVSQYLVCNFTYANEYDMKKIISKRKGNCYSAGQLMVKVYKALGYKAKVRLAIHDKKSRYPENLYMMSQHYNVQVKVKNKTYYLDATPQCGMVYLSSSKKVLDYYMDWGGYWMKME